MASGINRVSGLATGMDTDQIIADLMKVSRAPLDKLAQQKQIYQWQQDDYRTINTALRSFRDQASRMRLQSTYMVKAASSSNEAAFSATAASTATPGTYSVSVSQLAQGVTLGSQAALAEESNSDGSTKTLQEQFGLPADPLTFTLTGKVNGELKSQAFSIDPTAKSVYALAAEINGANLGLKASYDSVLNRFFLTSASTGSNAYVKVAGDSGGLLSDATGACTGILKLKITGDADPTVGNGQLGKDAVFNFGDLTGITSPTNNPTVNGISLSLKEEGAGGNITVSSDTEAVFKAITDFIVSYNNTVDAVNGKLSEVRYRDYRPLTDAQREEMSEDEIKKWEGYARSGLLRNDPILSVTVSKVRSAMSAVVSDLTGYNSLAGIGIKTGTWEEQGKLYIYEDELRNAINADPEAVMNLFTKTADSASGKGIAQRLYETVNNQIGAVTDKAGFASTSALYDNSILGEKIDGINDRMDDLEVRLTEIEDRYYRQFTALERAISQMNTQSAWLAQQFSSGSQ